MEIKEVIGMLENIMNERGVPRNVREALDNAINILNKDKGKKEKVSDAVSILDETAGDPNLATYVRTQIWGVVSLLEGMK